MMPVRKKAKKQKAKNDDDDLEGYEEYNPTLDGLVSFDKHGDTLEGLVIGIRKTQFGLSLMVESDGEEYLTPNLTTLEDFVNEVKELREQDNEVEIKLIYTDDKQGKYGKPYKIFKKGFKVVD